MSIYSRRHQRRLRTARTNTHAVPLASEKPKPWGENGEWETDAHLPAGVNSAERAASGGRWDGDGAGGGAEAGSGEGRRCAGMETTRRQEHTTFVYWISRVLDCLGYWAFVCLLGRADHGSQQHGGINRKDKSTGQPSTLCRV